MVGSIGDEIDEKGAASKVSIACLSLLGTMGQNMCK
jgi:hypothetical protein